MNQLPAYLVRANYECVRCKHQWTAKAGPTSCPECRSDYVTWLNHPLTVERGKVDQ